MTSISIFIGLSWIALSFYWFISARSVKPTQERAGGIGRYWHYVLMLVAFLFLETHFLISPLGVRLIPQSKVITSICAVLSLSGLAIAIIARRTLAKNWSLSVTFKTGHELITSSIYHYIRHPIYTGILLMFLSPVLVIGTLGGFIGLLILFLTFWFKLKQEEALMARHFPKEYPAYKNQVKSLIPFVF